VLINPAIIALVSGSLLSCMVLIYASTIGIRILRGWDITSGSEQQLVFERKTYLISTVLGAVMAYEVFSLLLFVYTADHIHGLFVGAMCAAGTLNVNDYGYPTLNLKILNAVVCGIWIIVNHTDNRGFDYPLIRPKYKFLLAITAMVLLESFLQWQYLKGLNPNVITSCCGTLFSEEAETIAGEMAHLPSYSTKVLFYSSLLLTLRVGIHFTITGRAARIFSYLSFWFFLVSIISTIAFVSVYFYELPTHHCPFCLLQREYGYIGYPLYLSLFGAAILGGGVGVIERFNYKESLREIIPGIQKGLCLTAMIGFLIFAVISTYPILFSDFILEGY